MTERNDLLWILIVSILILTLAYLPTWAGFRAETPVLKFRGIYFDSQDYSAHISMMEAGAHGEWSYQFRFTSEPLRPAYVRLFYIFLGHVGSWLGLNTEVTYHLALWFCGILALFSLYRLMQLIFQELFWARVAFLWAAIGSGLGWLQLIFDWTSTQITPIDFWFIDGYVFFGLSIFPHFAFVTAGFCLALCGWFLFIEKPEVKNILWIIVITFFVQVTNPIAFVVNDVAFIGAAVFAWWKTGKINLKHVAGLAVLAFFQIPVLVYNLITFSGDPLLDRYTSQHLTLSPPPEYYLWGFAPFLPFAAVGIGAAFRKRSYFLGAFVFWIFSAFVLAYSPFYTQSRFLQDITIPLGILATQGWIQIFESGIGRWSWLIRRRQILVILFVFAASLSTIQLSLGRAAYLQTHPEYFYYPSSLDAAIVWLRGHAHYDDIVLSSDLTSQVLAQKAGVRVYGGHEMETLNYKDKHLKLIAFLEGKFPELAHSPIKWVIYGPEERAVNPNFTAPENLELKYETSDLRIYQVK
jgi:hypothetical protein